jgi:hypothetical protein
MRHEPEAPDAFPLTKESGGRDCRQGVESGEIITLMVIEMNKVQVKDLQQVRAVWCCAIWDDSTATSLDELTRLTERWCAGKPLIKPYLAPRPHRCAKGRQKRLHVFTARLS